jgi:hypothetical protein
MDKVQKPSINQLSDIGEILLKVHPKSLYLQARLFRCVRFYLSEIKRSKYIFNYYSF